MSGTPSSGDTAGTADVSARGKAVARSYRTLAEFCDEKLLPFAFAGTGEERGLGNATNEPGGTRRPSGGAC